MGRGNIDPAQIKGNTGDPTKFLSETGFSVPASGGTFPVSFPNVAGEFLDSYNSATGLFTASTPAGSPSGLVLLASLSASSSASLDFKTRNASGQSGAIFQSDYDVYLIEIYSIILATNTQDFLLKMSSDGGVNWIGSGYKYIYESNSTGNNGFGAGNSTSAASIKLFETLDNAQNYGFECHIRWPDPLNASLKKSFTWTANSPLASSGARQYTVFGGGFYDTAGAINAFQLIAPSGAITSGKASVYGLAK